MIYKLSVMLAILNRGVTAQYKIICDGVTYNCEQTPYRCMLEDCADCKCVEEVVVVASTTEKATEPPTTEAPTKMSTEPPTTEAPTKMTTEPPTTEAPTKMTTEPPTSEAPAKASTKAPTDAPTKAPTTTTTTTTAAPTTTTTTASPGLALPWPKYPGRNCYWKNHGAEEVDYPWGKAVAKVNTLHACQAACVEAADFGCHGVLFQVATGNCYRKKDIVVEKCVRDESVDLYVRPSATVFVDRLE